MLHPHKFRSEARSTAQGLIDLEDREPWAGLNETPFVFRHKLAHHPLFTLPRLAELSERVFERSDYGRYFTAADMALPQADLKRHLREGILDIATNGRWIGLHYIDEMDPAYEELFDQLLADVEEITRTPIRQRMAWGSLSVFLTAPGLVAPYHFDHETNFLMQIQGEKDVRLYPHDRATVSEEEIEDFYRYNPGAGRFREELADAGTVFRLTPGTAVHHPPLAPHLIKNSQEVSISVAIYYVMPEMEYTARVYQVNYCLRRLGLHPRPPGSSPFWDAAKERLIRALSTSNPRTHDEMLYSGIKRLAKPIQLTNRLRSGLRRG
jgi:hypothetical protein